MSELNGVRIRRFAPADAEAVRSLITGILAAEYAQDQAAYPAADLEKIAAVYGGPREAFLVADDGGRIVGTCAVKQDGETTAILRRFFVATTHRGQGLGVRLVEEAIAHCRTHGYRMIRIRTSGRMAAAIAVCRRHGFQEDERIQLGTVHLIMMSLRVS
ncbi:MAG: hypothetical protein A3C53_00480 [Omnitrophica WOR_2 bacterium RIFCSPHIGHO2_02_FULL_68_15]|nr:MAG: hypothetical protein A3C53_00480 [Omnitrophica WOR_2 bacterium RIFCSPHIGHO2_02_FULL_68_15]